jgi:hypothetical protein
MPEETMMLDQVVATMLVDRTGKKFVTRRDVVATAMDRDFELRTDDGKVHQGQIGDFLVRDISTGEFQVWQTAAFTEHFKSPRKSRTKTGSRATLPPEKTESDPELAQTEG